MRMWMVNPKYMCRQHLLGEHVELHMFMGTLKKEIRFDGYIQNNLFEPKSLIARHGELVTEMRNRGYKHHSKIDHNEVIHYLQLMNEFELNAEINKKKAFDDLMSRCPKCKKRYEKEKR